MFGSLFKQWREYYYFRKSLKAMSPKEAIEACHQRWFASLEPGVQTRISNSLVNQAWRRNRH